MFSNNKDTKRDQVEMSNAALTTIAKGTVLEGNIETFGQIRIEGKVTGYIKTQSRLVLGDSSVIEGNTFSQNAEIGGEVRGTVQVSDVLVLKSTAVVHGDIVTGKLVVEAGAIWNGNCKMGAAKDKSHENLLKENTLKETNVPKDLRTGDVLNGKAKNKNSQLNNYLKYSGLGIQMLAAIGLAVWGGMKLDEWLELKFPAFTVTLSCLALIGTLVAFIRSLPKE